MGHEGANQQIVPLKELDASQQDTAVLFSFFQGPPHHVLKVEWTQGR